jgi:glucose/arabinose dehydrogenase
MLMSQRPCAVCLRWPVFCLWLLLASGCGAAAVAPTPAALPTAAPTAPPTAPPTAATTPDTRPTVVLEPTPTLGNPKALRDDIKIRRVFQTGGGFVRLKHDPQTDTVYYMNSTVDIYQLSFESSGQVRANKTYTRADVGVADDFVAAGMAFGPDGTLYVVGNIATATTTQGIVRRGKPDAAGKRTWTTLASTAPYEKSNTQFDHVCNGIVVSPDGRFVYMNSGSRTDHGEVQDSKGTFPNLREVPLTSAIFRIPTDADDQMLPNDEAQLKAKGYLFADGTRNSYDLAFSPDGDLFAGDNGPDADYPDELNWLQEGHHYGFPWRLGDSDNPQRSPSYDPSKDGRLQPEFFAVKNNFYHNDPTFPAPPDGVTFTDPVANLGPDADVFRDPGGGAHDSSDLGQPAFSFTPHRSELGLVFDANGAVGGDLKNGAFILSWGAAEGHLPDHGRDLLHLKLTKTGDAYQMQATQLAVGFDHPIDQALVGNKLYVLDWGGKGAIWEVTLP